MVEKTDSTRQEKTSRKLYNTKVIKEKREKKNVSLQHRNFSDFLIVVQRAFLDTFLQEYLLCCCYNTT